MLSRLLLTAGLLVTSSTARANVPDPNHCTIPTRVVMCPEGDLSAEFIIRDFADVPIAGAIVVLDFSRCSEFLHCANPIPPGVTNVTVDDVNRHILGVTDANGRIGIQVAMTGPCLDQGNPIEIPMYADGVPLHAGTVPTFLMSADQNGDLIVDAFDEAIMNVKIANPTPANIATADLNGDDLLDTTDLAILRGHLAHICNASTPVRRTGWGRLKLLYR
jgi:hypothetical protein